MTTRPSRSLSPPPDVRSSTCPPDRSPAAPQASRRRYAIVAAYSALLCLSGAYLYRLARWMQTHGPDWIGPVVFGVLFSAGFVLLGVQVFRAVSRRRFLHLLLMLLILLSFFPAFVNLHRPLERFHLLEYGLLGALIFWARSPRRYSLQFYLGSLGYLLLLGFVDELLQGVVVGRYYDLQDVWINVFSGTIGILVMRMMDLNAPLPLHPRPRHEDAGPLRPAPLIDLHIYGRDLLYVLPVLLVLGTDLVLTRSLRLEDLRGDWCDDGRGIYALQIQPDHRSLLLSPDCKTTCRCDLEGNLLDGFRLALGDVGVPLDWSPPCKEAFRRRFRTGRDDAGNRYLEREGTGRLYRSGPSPTEGTGHVSPACPAPSSRSSERR